MSLFLRSKAWYSCLSVFLVSCSLLTAGGANSQADSPFRYEIGVRYALPIDTGLDESYKDWSVEVQEFSEKLQSAYDLPLDKANKYSEWILLAKLYSGISEFKLASIIRAESNFREDAVSSVGAIGPMQIRPEIWKDWCSTDINDPYGNIECGSQIYMHYNSHCKKNWDCTLAMYNVGPGNLKKKSRFYKAAKKRYQKKFYSNLAMIRDVG